LEAAYFQVYASAAVETHPLNKLFFGQHVRRSASVARRLTASEQFEHFTTLLAEARRVTRVLFEEPPEPEWTDAAPGEEPAAK
jgi:hypothetical protein